MIDNNACTHIIGRISEGNHSSSITIKISAQIGKPNTLFNLIMTGASRNTDVNMLMGGRSRSITPKIIKCINARQERNVLRRIARTTIMRVKEDHSWIHSLRHIPEIEVWHRRLTSHIFQLSWRFSLRINKNKQLLIQNIIFMDVDLNQCLYLIRIWFRFTKVKIKLKVRRRSSIRQLDS